MNSKRDLKTVQGTIAYFTFEKDTTKYFKLDFPNGDGCFCKGREIEGQPLYKGQKLKLYGEWKVNPNPKYTQLGEQFYFSGYENVLSVEQSEAGQVISKILPEQKNHQEEVTGVILRFTNFKDNSRIFRLQAEDKNEFYCVGNLIKGREIYEGYKVKLYGKWGINKNRPNFGEQFYYRNYEVIPKSGPKKIIKRKGDPVVSIGDYLQRVGSVAIVYQYHKPQLDKIAGHVKKQLFERIINSTNGKKDFYFLTALFDRIVNDDEVQTFRALFPDLKDRLVKCWIEAEPQLSNAIQDISHTLKNEHIVEHLKTKSFSFKTLAQHVPGEYGINQLLLCLKIIKDYFFKELGKHVSDYVTTLEKEKSLRNDIRDDKKYWGIGPKLANWSITNVTGHWFVLDYQIKKLINRDLLLTTLPGIEVIESNSDQVFENWFGRWNERENCFDQFSLGTFETVFADFEEEHYEYLPFIVTQYLWFYGKFGKK